MTRWKGKVAVVTGAASGIGAALARHCAAQGMQVVAADVDTAGLEALAAQVSAENGALKPVHLDVTSSAAVEAFASVVFAEHGCVNLLFNNAGVLVDGKSWERRVEDWRWIIEVNVMGVINGIRSFVPKMLGQGEEGRVINTSSIGGLLGGGAYMAPYQGTKHMVTAITESLYQELKEEEAPISASVLCPAEVATGIWESDRLRPESERNVLQSEQEQQSHDAIAGGVAEGLRPEEFAPLVFAGIEAEKFWLLPQPGFKGILEMRHKSVMEETDPLGMAELMNLAEI